MPVHDGAQAETAYGVESVPRFVVIDAAGVVTWTFAGVGNETGSAVRVQLDRVLGPARPNSPTGTTRVPAPGTGVPFPRP